MKIELPKIGKVILLLCGILGMHCCNALKYSGQKGDYFGQTLPGQEAEIFMPNVISLPDRGEYSIAFSSDGNECYFSCYQNNSSSIYYAQRVNNTWERPSEVTFSNTIKFDLSSLSDDGNTILLENGNDIWIAERKDGLWSEPKRLLSPINSASNDHGYSITSDGVVYISSSRPNGSGNSFEIWRVLPSSDRAESLGTIVNSNLRNLTPCIARDGSYIIFTQSDTSYEYLCVSFYQGGNQWTEPVNMNIAGARINIATYQNRPTLSPDGKFLFFNSHDSNNADKSDIYWVNADVIEGIRIEVLK
ncbi:MAG TPA: hypothetical protein DD477_09750 [Spirochaetaceae bacterium]|nr:hypothetical protein [Spirochaetaceae bacterium]HAW85140.1 hypothetical protein [Spirochaetaceae bacterium]HAX36276.1 hypothetical protein [Spirochaetaceae bacterium]HBO41487.1 hypothetical protein [Spirochaetaceae bacterium]HCQ86250.1 hypothetical protein [Spirochaetaceae bacterium]